MINWNKMQGYSFADKTNYELSDEEIEIQCNPTNEYRYFYPFPLQFYAEINIDDSIQTTNIEMVKDIINSNGNIIAHEEGIIPEKVIEKPKVVKHKIDFNSIGKRILDI